MTTDFSLSFYCTLISFLNTYHVCSNDSFGGLLRYPPRPPGGFLESQNPNDYDARLYPEMYRKTHNPKGSNDEAKSPFDIGIILEVYTPMKNVRDNVRVRVRRLYRPYQIKMSAQQVFTKDANLVYWSEDEVTIEASRVAGKCFVRAASSLKVIHIHK